MNWNPGPVCWWTTGALIALLLFAPGCASERPKAQALPAPPSEQVRASLGNIGLVSGTLATNGFFQHPMTKNAGAGSGALGGALWGLNAGAEAGKGGGELGAMMAIAVWAVAIPAGTIIGTFRGHSAGESPKVIDRIEQELQTAILGLNLQESVVQEMERAACQRAQRRLLIIREEDASFRKEYGALTNKGIDTVLEVIVQKAGLCGFAGSDKLAPLAAFIQVSVRLVRASDGTVLYGHTWIHKRGQLPFADWAQNHGDYLRRELQALPSGLADNIAEELFLIYDPGSS